MGKRSVAFLTINPALPYQHVTQKLAARGASRNHFRHQFVQIIIDPDGNNVVSSSTAFAFTHNIPPFLFLSASSGHQQN
jgi:hypothetical protein